MTTDQVTEWFATANKRLDFLKGPFDFWGQGTPMPVEFCDGHGVHQGDLAELRRALYEAKERVLSPRGEDGPACEVTAGQAFIEIFSIIANAERVGGEVG
jgi:hypothetical protein